MRSSTIHTSPDDDVPARPATPKIPAVRPAADDRVGARLGGPVARSTGFRMTDETRSRLRDVMEVTGLPSMQAVFDVAVSEFLERRGLPIRPDVEV